jgi:hypothetical protein
MGIRGEHVTAGYEVAAAEYTDEHRCAAIAQLTTSQVCRRSQWPDRSQSRAGTRFKLLGDEGNCSMRSGLPAYDATGPGALVARGMSQAGTQHCGGALPFSHLAW